MFRLNSIKTFKKRYPRGSRLPAPMPQHRKWAVLRCWPPPCCLPHYLQVIPPGLGPSTTLLVSDVQDSTALWCGPKLKTLTYLVRTLKALQHRALGHAPLGRRLPGCRLRAAGALSPTCQPRRGTTLDARCVAGGALSHELPVPGSPRTPQLKSLTVTNGPDPPDLTP